MNLASIIAALQAGQDPNQAVIDSAQPGVMPIPQGVQARPVPYLSPSAPPPAEPASQVAAAPQGPPTGARTPVTNPQPSGQSPTTVQSPPDLANMYVKLMERNQNAAALDSGLTLMAAGLSNNLTTRHALIQNAASSGGGRGAGGITSADIINLTKQQQEMKNNLLRQSMLGGLAKQYNLSPETIQYLEASGKLDEVIKHHNTQNLQVIEDNKDGSKHFYDHTGKWIAQVGGPKPRETMEIKNDATGEKTIVYKDTGEPVRQVVPKQEPGQKVHQLDDELFNINKGKRERGEPEWTLEQLIKAKQQPGTTVNVGPQGNPLTPPEKGYEYERNPDGSVKVDEKGRPIQYKIPGAKPAEEAAEKITEEAKVKGKEAVAAAFRVHNVGNAVNTALDKVDKFGNADWAASIARKLPIVGQDWNTMNSALKTIDANTAFEALKQMRAASPTGASGLGQVTDVEQQMLKAVIGDLSPFQEKETLRANLIRVKVATHLLADDNFGGDVTKFNAAFEKALKEEMAAEKAKRGIKDYDPEKSGIRLRPRGT